MDNQEIIDNFKEFFNITECVDKDTYNIFGESAWQFFDVNLLHSIYLIRKCLSNPIIINNWSNGGDFSQRGLRTNICSIVKSKTNANKLYISAHVTGKAFDFDVKGMRAQDVREWINENAIIFPCKIRLESNVNWVHLDTYHDKKNPKIYNFKV